MRSVSFLLMILAVAWTSSVRGQQAAGREAVRDAVRDAVLEGREPARDARREGRQESRDDRQEARETRRDDRQEARGDRGDDHELLRLALLRRFATGILEIGSRSERNVARVARKVATIDKRRARLVGMIDKRCAAIGETTTSCYALRLLRRFATGILEIGSRSERNVARVARKVATIDKRRARLVGMIDKRCAAIGETTTSCYALRYCGASQRGFWRSAVGQRGTSRRSTRGARGTSGRAARVAPRRRFGLRRPRVGAG